MCEYLNRKFTVQTRVIARTIADGSFEEKILVTDMLDEEVPFKDEVCVVPPINSN